jgi:Phage integrase, N-terminal SAM-like domain
LLEILDQFADWFGWRAHTLLSFEVPRVKILTGENGLSLQLPPSLYHLKTSLFEKSKPEIRSKQWPVVQAPMTPKVAQTEAEKVILAPFDLLEGISESARAKTAETFLELLGARVRNPNKRSAYRVAWRSFLAFCSARQLELESVKAYHVGSWLDQHPGSRSTQRQHLAAVRLLFDSLMMRGVVE